MTRRRRRKRKQPAAIIKVGYPKPWEARKGIYPGRLVIYAEYRKGAG